MDPAPLSDALYLMFHHFIHVSESLQQINNKLTDTPQQNTWTNLDEADHPTSEDDNMLSIIKRHFQF